MNNLQATKVLDSILSNDINKFNNKECVLIDGGWGIGKTHFIQSYFSEKVNELELIYTSVFGKRSVSDIEKSVLINSLPGVKKINEDNGFIKVAKNILNDMCDKHLGLSIESYINSFSIEDIKWSVTGDKRRIVCFDDIERKSDSIEIKDLLGLIERTTKQFDVIIIGNFGELNEEDRELFNRYKEKIVDQVVKLDRIEKDTLSDILKIMKTEGRNEIIDVYLSDNIAFGKSYASKKFFQKNKVYNLRVFIKYVELILKLEKLLDPYEVNKELLGVCKCVLYDHHYQNKDEKKDSMNFDKFNKYKMISKILMNEQIKKDEFQEYFMINSEVRKDISNIYNAYKFNEEQFDNILKKINVNIEEKNLEYFIKQENVISLVSALNEFKKFDDIMIKNLFEITVDLYSPEKQGLYNNINYLNWNDVDNYGYEIECDNDIKLFIKRVNQKCTQKFQNFINEKLESLKITKNYEDLLNIYNFNQIKEIKDFEAIFDYYFNQLVENYSRKTAERINTLISKTNSNIISNFFSNRIKNETQITKIKKYELFDFELERKMHIEDQAEYYANNQPEEVE